MADRIEISMSEASLVLLLSECDSYRAFELIENDEDEEAPDEEDEDEDKHFDGEWRLMAPEKDLLWLFMFSSIPSLSILFMR